MHLNGKNRKISFNGRKVARNEQMDRKFMFMKLFWAQGVICICPGAILKFLVWSDRDPPPPSMYLNSVTTLLRMFNLTNSTIDSMAFYTIRLE